MPIPFCCIHFDPRKPAFMHVLKVRLFTFFDTNIAPLTSFIDGVVVCDAIYSHSTCDQYRRHHHREIWCPVRELVELQVRFGVSERGGYRQHLVRFPVPSRVISLLTELFYLSLIALHFTAW